MLTQEYQLAAEAFGRTLEHNGSEYATPHSATYETSDGVLKINIVPDGLGSLGREDPLLRNEIYFKPDSEEEPPHDLGYDVEELAYEIVWDRVLDK